MATASDDSDDESGPSDFFSLDALYEKPVRVEEDFVYTSQPPAEPFKADPHPKHDYELPALASEYWKNFDVDTAIKTAVPKPMPKAPVKRSHEQISRATNVLVRRSMPTRLRAFHDRRGIGSAAVKLIRDDEGRVCSNVDIFSTHSTVSELDGKEYYNNVIPKITERMTVCAHEGAVTRVRWCPVIDFSHLLVTTSLDGSVRVWDGLTGNTMPTCLLSYACHASGATGMDWCADGKRILTCGYDKRACKVDLETGKFTDSFSTEGVNTAIKQHPTNSSLAVIASDDCIHLWDVRIEGNTSAMVFKHKSAMGQVQDVEFLRPSGGSAFASCSSVVDKESAERTVIVWDVKTGSYVSNQIFQGRKMVSHLRSHPTVDAFLAQSHAGYVTIFHTEPPYRLNRFKRFEGHKVAPHNLGFDISPDGTIVVTCDASVTNSLVFYDYQSGYKIGKLRLDCELPTDVSWHPLVDSMLAVCSSDGRLVICT